MIRCTKLISSSIGRPDPQRMREFEDWLRANHIRRTQAQKVKATPKQTTQRVTAPSN